MKYTTTIVAIVLTLLVMGGIYYAMNKPKDTSGLLPGGIELATSTGSVATTTEGEPLTAKAKKLNNMVTIKTNYGEIEIELFADKAPNTVANFEKLIAAGFYSDTLFHRVIKGFMIQGGDPNSKDHKNWATHGMGGPGYAFADEINDEKLVRGVLAMANAGPNTNGSQFFIVTAPSTPWLDGKHTAFGKVVKGMEVVDKIENVKVGAADHPEADVVVESMTVK